MNEHRNENNISGNQKVKNPDLEETQEVEKEVLEEPPKKKPIKNILIVDDEEPIRKLYKRVFENFGYKVMVASDGNEGMALFRENPADLIITDIFMPEKDGHAFILEIMQEFPRTKVFAITGKITMMGIETELDIAKTLGAIKIFTKPVSLSELLEAIK
ncbi:MAG: response regulator, partial [Desulfobacterales bacterium]|nr:response regulator [Desulfobacterales bacterium]